MDEHIYDTRHPLDRYLSQTWGEANRLAQAVGISPSRMTQIRKGRSVPDLALALRLSQQTGIPVEAFAPAKADS